MNVAALALCTDINTDCEKDYRDDEKTAYLFVNTDIPCIDNKQLDIRVRIADESDFKSYSSGFLVKRAEMIAFCRQTLAMLGEKP